jgi:cell division protein FtsN
MTARRTAATPRKRSTGGFLFGLFAGVALGLLVALGVGFYFDKLPFTTAKAKFGEKEQATKSSAATPEKLTFYDILPRTEVPVSERELREKMRQAPAAPTAKKEVSKDVYFVQTGSFQNATDADKQKARLALLGFESSVAPATLPDKGTWYRVRMGPYVKLEEIDRVRQAVKQNGIEASLVKIKDQR